MTVSAIFRLPDGSDYHRELPVCTHRMLMDMVAPIADRLKLDLIGEWGTILEINSDNLDVFIEQLDTLMAALEKELTIKKEYSESFNERLMQLRNIVTSGFEHHPDLVVII